MFKRSSANYSLWPEQARPRRGMSFSLAAGGFAAGIVCAIAIVNVGSQVLRPMAMEEEPVQDAVAVAPIPVYSGPSTLVAAKPAESGDKPIATPNRPRVVAKVTLPTIGRAVPVVSETDGRGGETAVKMPPVRLTDDAGVAAATVNATPKLIRNTIKTEVAAPAEKPAPAVEETKVASREPASEAVVEPTVTTPTYAARPERRVKSRSQQRRVERSRSRTSRSQQNYYRAARRGRSQQPSYAARYRAGPVYGANGAPINGYFSN